MTFYLNYLFICIILIYLSIYKLDILYIICAWFFYFFSVTMVCSEIHTGDQLLWYVACISFCSKRIVENEAFKAASLIIIRGE